MGKIQPIKFVLKGWNKSVFGYIESLKVVIGHLDLLADHNTLYVEEVETRSKAIVDLDLYLGKWFPIALMIILESVLKVIAINKNDLSPHELLYFNNAIETNFKR